MDTVFEAVFCHFSAAALSSSSFLLLLFLLHRSTIWLIPSLFLQKSCSSSSFQLPVWLLVLLFCCVISPLDVVVVLFFFWFFDSYGVYCSWAFSLSPSSCEGRCVSSVLLIEVFEDFFFLQRGSFFGVGIWVLGSWYSLVFWWWTRALRLGDRKLWVRRLSSKAGFMINLIPIFTACRNSGYMRRVR